MNEATNAIVLRGLTRRFGERTAVDGLDLDVRKGECLGLLGPNGAGKSTTVRILSTLLRADAGTLRVLGHDPATEALELSRRIGVVPQELAVYGHLSARENLRFFARLQGLRGDRLQRAVGRGLALAGLEDRSQDPVRTFSGGMKRRLNVAVALLHEPELVFLDEPTVGIDPQSRNHVFEVVEELSRNGITMVYTSHQLGEVERLCDRIVILDRGRKVAEGSLAELQAATPRADGGAVGLSFVNRESATRALAVLERAGLEASVDEEAPDLETIFLALTGRELRDGGEQ